LIYSFWHDNNFLLTTEKDNLVRTLRKVQNGDVDLPEIKNSRRFS